MSKKQYTTEELTGMLDYGLDVYRHYINQPIKLKDKMISPFPRANGLLEKDPSFSVYFNNKKNVYFYKDHGLEKTGTHWQFVMDLFGIDFKEAILKVKKDILGLGDGYQGEIKKVYYNNTVIKNTPVEIIPAFRDWTNYDLDYFSNRGINKSTLDIFNVKPISYFDHKKENKTIRIKTPETSPAYCYILPSGRVKICQPFHINPKYKWTSNLVAEEDVFGFHLIPKECDDLFLIGGNNDTMSFYQNIGYPVMAFSSESTNIPDALLYLINRIAKRVWVLYDNDEQGYRKAKKFQDEFGFIPINHIYKRFKGSNPDNTANDFCDLFKTSGSSPIHQFSYLIDKEIAKWN